MKVLQVNIRCKQQCPSPKTSPHLHDQIADACRRANRPVERSRPHGRQQDASRRGHPRSPRRRPAPLRRKPRPGVAGKIPARRRNSPTSKFHLIGPLQSNKTTKAAELFHAIDTVDSLKIAERLNPAAAALNKTLPVLIEVKLSPEDTKHGLAPEDLPTLLDDSTPLTHLIAADS